MKFGPILYGFGTKRCRLFVIICVRYGISIFRPNANTFAFLLPSRTTYSGVRRFAISIAKFFKFFGNYASMIAKKCRQNVIFH
jgi:hypothetical protein